MPFRSQDAAPSSGHSAPGSVALRTNPQVPSAPLPLSAAVHARQRPVQAWSQHTPSAQKPEIHCAFRLQLVPFAPSGRQLLLAVSHQEDAMHKVSLVQVVAQTVVFRH